MIYSSSGWAAVNWALKKQRRISKITERKEVQILNLLAHETFQEKATHPNQQKSTITKLTSAILRNEDLYILKMQKQNQKMERKRKRKLQAESAKLQVESHSISHFTAG